MAISMAFTCFADPLQISVQLSLYLLLTLQLKKLAPVLHTLPFFRKLSVSHTHMHAKKCSSTDVHKMHIYTSD